ncbi:hypothetical protein D3218_08060 [Aureimonas flava]|uniref:DUF4148 domain-containing protein n=1 Tax=Aureimonas flava TaxID=2320271 RepID=A0A3A1WTR8_9HYPH|nr:hypothetical protein [Aureimonas flava]RIY01311.1 hypothetical protein D3218_08060 [Aureimonas flava]
MKTMTMIAAALIATAGFGNAALAQQTKPMLTGQEKAVRYQHDQQEKMWDQERLASGRTAQSATYGAPNRQSFGRTGTQAEPKNAAPASFGIPGSGAAFYNHDANSKSWAYGY